MGVLFPLHRSWFQVAHAWKLPGTVCIHLLLFTLDLTNYIVPDSDCLLFYTPLADCVFSTWKWQAAQLCGRRRLMFRTSRLLCMHVYNIYTFPAQCDPLKPGFVLRLFGLTSTLPFLFWSSREIWLMKSTISSLFCQYFCTRYAPYIMVGASLCSLLSRSKDICFQVFVIQVREM